MRALRLRIGSAGTVLKYGALKRYKIVHEESRQLVHYYRKIARNPQLHSLGWGGTRYQKFSFVTQVEISLVVWHLMCRNPTYRGITYLQILRGAPFFFPVSRCMLFRLFRSWRFSFKRPVVQQLVFIIFWSQSIRFVFFRQNSRMWTLSEQLLSGSASCKWTQNESNMWMNATS